MRVRCATQRDHVFHPEMNYSQTQLDQLDRLTERWVADHLQKGKTSKENKELVTPENLLHNVYCANNLSCNRHGISLLLMRRRLYFYLGQAVMGAATQRLRLSAS